MPIALKIRCPCPFPNPAPRSEPPRRTKIFVKLVGPMQEAMTALDASRQSRDAGRDARHRHVQECARRHELRIAQEGVRKVIPIESAMQGWNQSLESLGRHVELNAAEHRERSRAEPRSERKPLATGSDTWTRASRILSSRWISNFLIRGVRIAVSCRRKPEDAAQNLRNCPS